MPSPFHQNHATSQNHGIFGMMNDQRPTNDPTDRRGSTGSTSSMGDTPSSPDSQRRRSSVSRFANLEALKRPQDNAEHAARRASFTDHKPAPGMLGTWWNNFTRGPSSPPSAAAPKEARDTSTLRQ